MKPDKGEAAELAAEGSVETDATPPNLGPMSAAVLRRCGILNTGQLRNLGPARAYVVVKREYGRAPRSLLWALEGALSRRPWQQLGTAERLSLLREVEEIEQGKEGDLTPE